MGFQVFDERRLLILNASIDDSYAGGAVAFGSADDAGWGIDQISFCSNDTVATVATVLVGGPTIEFAWSSVLIPPGAGTDGTTEPASIFDSNPTTLQRLNLAPGTDLAVIYSRTPSTGKFISGNAAGGRY